jgi:hypothetical protein
MYLLSAQALLTMVHGKTFRIITRKILQIEYVPPNHYLQRIGADQCAEPREPYDDYTFANINIRCVCNS